MTISNYSPAIYAAELAQELEAYLNEHPSGDAMSMEEAAEGSKLSHRAKKCMQDIDAERTDKVAPLNAQVKAINDEAKAAATPLVSGRDILDTRLQSFVQAEEGRRAQKAEEAREVAQQAAEAVQRTFEAVKESETGAAAGTMDVDLLADVRRHDETMALLDKASDHLKRMEREITVRLPQGFGDRVRTARTEEEPEITDIILAIQSIGLTAKIRDAILSSARAWKKTNGGLQWPPGIHGVKTRRL